MVAGTTLIIDLPYPGYPDNMGHWAETLLPIYSVLSSEAWRRDVGKAGGSPHIDTILFSNLRRQQLQVHPHQSCLVGAENAVIASVRLQQGSSKGPMA